MTTQRKNKRKRVNKRRDERDWKRNKNESEGYCGIIPY